MSACSSDAHRGYSAPAFEARPRRGASNAMGSDRPKRILMVLHMPWTPNLGASRVSVDLAASFRAAGYVVEKFDIGDAFPRPTRLSRMLHQAWFHRAARDFVRANAARFDIIQAEQGNLPYSKAELGFAGRLVVRSNGLAHFYETVCARVDADPRVNRGSWGGQLVRRVVRALARETRRVERSFDAADEIVLINRDEHQFVTAVLGHGDKAHLIPLGLHASTLDAFDRPGVSAHSRHAARTVSFVGSWSTRKGVHDLPRIVRAVRAALPNVRFKLMGTGAPAATVLGNFDEQDRRSLEVVSSYELDALPALLDDVTVGVLPSYIEGFGLSVLEQLAAGVPTLTYDVPGPREMLRDFPEPLMVPAGDADALARRLVEVLSLPPARYADLSRRARGVAEDFRWEPVAARTLAVYVGDEDPGVATC